MAQVAGQPPRDRSAADEPNSAPLESRQARNFASLALYQVLLRIGWIFKTESIIIPAFLDTIAGAGWLRGCLPALNRLGQSVPPVLLAGSISPVPKKKWALAGYTIPMAIVCLVLAGICALVDEQRTRWMPPVFLLLYAIFFASTGLSQLAYGTLQGKLIHPRLRGRLLSVASAVGAPAAILFAWWLLGSWLALPDGGFSRIFAFAGVSFVLAAIAAALVREDPDRAVGSASSLKAQLRESWRAIEHDAGFRRLAIVTALFGTVLLLFPHYQALARERLGISFEYLMTWVIIQNIGTGVFSAIVGPLADWRGQRLGLQVLIFGCAAVPLVAIGITYLDDDSARLLFSAVFLLIGMTPVALKTLVNYTLEISQPADHARYISTINLVLAAPFCISPLVGWLVDYAGFDLVMLLGAVVILSAGVLAFGLIEPRHAPEEPVAGLEEITSE